MKLIRNLLTASFLVALTMPAIAAECLEDCQHQKSLKNLTGQILEHSTHGPQDEGCPAAGSKLIDPKLSVEGGLLGAKKSLQQINDGLTRLALPLQKDQTQCGSCKQNNVVTDVAVSRPKTDGTDATCAAHPNQMLRGDFADVNELTNYVQDTLQGNNNEGSKLYAGCPDPCSFYVYDGSTPLSNGKVHLTMMVRCGQPRGGIFSKYVFSGALVHEWTCQK